MMTAGRRSGYTVSAGILAQIGRYLTSRNVDAAAFFRSHNIDPEMLSSPDVRIPVELYISVEDAVAHVTCDPYSGLHMGQFMEAGSWSILGYMMMNCKTLNEAFKKSEKYSAIIGNLITGDFQMNSNHMFVQLNVPDNAPVISRHCYEGYFSSMMCLARALSGRDIRPVEVGFAFCEPESVDEYTKVFGSPVLFGQNRNYLILDKSTGDIPVLAPNANLLEYFENYANEVLSGIGAPQNMTYQVKKLILSNMDNENLTIAFIARELSMSVRALQAQLKREGTEFSGLLREMRLQLAQKYLRESYTVEDITYLLGFLDPVVFRRAFKKWTNMTPKEYREKNAV